MARNKDNENGTDLGAREDDPQANQTLLTCKSCGDTERYMTAQLEGKRVWTCGGCAHQNSLPNILSAKLNKYEVVPSGNNKHRFTVTAHRVARVDGYFEFWIDNELSFAVNQSEVLYLMDLKHELRFEVKP